MVIACDTAFSGGGRGGSLPLVSSCWIDVPECRLKAEEDAAEKEAAG